MRPSLLVAAILAISPLALHADTTIFSTSFEAPTYNPGPVAGQGSIYQNNGTSGTIESGVAHTGTQAVEFDASTDHATPNEQSLDGILTSFTATPTDSTVDIQMSAEFTSANSNTNFDILALYSTGAFLDQLLYTNGIVYLGSSGNPGVAVSTGVWNTYGLHIDYTTDTITALVNGTVVESSTFSSSIHDLTAVDFGINSAPGNDTAYFDDLSLTTNPVPEPSSLALLGTGVLALAGATRRKLFSR